MVTRKVFTKVMLLLVPSLSRMSCRTSLADLKHRNTSLQFYSHHFTLIIRCKRSRDSRELPILGAAIGQHPSLDTRKNLS